MAQTLDVAGDLIRRCKQVQLDADAWRPWSTGEKLAVGLLLNRPDILASVSGGYTILEAVDRVGEDWMCAVMIAHRRMQR